MKKGRQNCKEEDDSPSLPSAHTLMSSFRVQEAYCCCPHSSNRHNARSIITVAPQLRFHGDRWMGFRGKIDDYSMNKPRAAPGYVCTAYQIGDVLSLLLLEAGVEA